MKLVNALGLVWLAVGCNGVSYLGDGVGGSGGAVGQGGSAGVVGSGGSGGAWSPCAGLPCGTSCNMAACPPSQAVCPAIYAQGYCDQNGACTQSVPECPTDACAGKACGDHCTLPCSNGACPNVAWQGYCNQTGSCTLNYPVCGSSVCQQNSDCSAPLPAPCQQCPDGSSVCTAAACVNGQCAGVMPGCPSYNPCGDKACGDQCWPCDPAKTGCPAPGGSPMYCNADLGCQAGEPACGNGYASCQTIEDCPRLPYPCRLCPNAQDPSALGCAPLTCLGGSCLLACQL
jgi:hypothetical protein